MINWQKLLLGIYVAITAIALGIGLFFGATYLLFAPSLTEIKRVTSPDKKVDAVLVQSDSNATVPAIYRVYVVPVGNRFKDGGFEDSKTLLLADYVKGLDIGWKKTEHLDIKYEEARIHRFRNFIELGIGVKSDYLIKVRLIEM